MSQSRSPQQKTKKSTQPTSAIPQWIGQGFVGYQDGLSKDQLEKLLNPFQPSQRSSGESEPPISLSKPAYFLKWIHRVSGIVDSLKDLPAEFPSPEGQMFTDIISLRWQQRGNRYDVIIFSSKPLEQFKAFKPIADNDRPVTWETRLLPALPHDVRNPQYPNRFIYQGISEKHICQRYFRDARTGIVHFVTLALKNHD
ncbi:MAG: hypothetical protein HC865_24085 [Cyanobacteria bacterium RU_5_0]|nr:hypothetical protein [Cyanobacteria bacterium RU_5_0]